MSQSNPTNPFGDKRTALAFFLSLIVIVAYTELLLKPDEQAQRFRQEQLTAQQRQTPSTSAPSAKEDTKGPVPITNSSGTVTTTPSGTTSAATTSISVANTGPVIADGTRPAANSDTTEQSTVANNSQTPAETPSTIANAKTTTIQTSLYAADITHLGALLKSYRLKRHTKELGGEELLDLVQTEDDSLLPSDLPFGIKLLGGDDRAIAFSDPVITTPSNASSGIVTLENGEEAQVTFQVSLENGGAYTKQYRFVGGTYFVEVSAELSAPPVGATPLQLAWSTFVPEEAAKNTYDPVNFSFLFPNDKVEHIRITELGEKTGQREEVARWGSLGDKYFMASLIALGDSQEMTAERAENNYTLWVKGSPEKVAAKAYIGPKNYSELKKLNFVELHRNVNLGYFSFLAIPLLTVINFCYGLLGNYGLAIILLTLIIKFAFLPLTQVSLKSMKAMQDLQPEIKALRERISDPNQLNQEMFALYKRKGVNPMGGCLPMLIQIPVFLGLYNALLNATELRHSPFALWITDLSAPEALNLFGIPVPVMIILMGLSMFFQQWLMPSNMDEQQKKIMMMMPVVFTIMFIVFPFPSGLVLYWLTNNLISIVQQVYLRTERSLGPVQATAVASVAIFLVGFILTKL
ncbi:MAG: membrane protein insertase YidC [Bdellovibrionales bacterium]|nr:membrane protein insertase YidC [Bdellovibrionales bacterium]